jgi:hypothetical protein
LGQRSQDLNFVELALKIDVTIVGATPKALDIRLRQLAAFDDGQGDFFRERHLLLVIALARAL